ncbi:hypothetical protein BO85DRAFT_449951 [Aspergillus piperis CBS 112811]|uniref:Uncharacterized protein n=1 Tax=Aspergillus piperis CBS 112811 TaxID=1448313 RepID=A0A8G1R139_9EURO|nr:hypothetical protein BO85DRAFT_449951 [Aspergillus piperis CBS 112811]RAH57227.1 hypothetical protein BO85DRAFT_449951 [Aspergillus piperis CBS 112811]
MGNNPPNLHLRQQPIPVKRAALPAYSNNGSHIRLEGLETFLQGVIPQAEAISDGVAQVNIDVSTSGVYADIQDGKIFHFSSLPRQVRLIYEIDESGDIVRWCTRYLRRPNTPSRLRLLNGRFNC